MKSFLKSLIDRFSPDVFRPTPTGLLHVFLQAVSREISGECPWDTGDECWRGFKSYWFPRCRNNKCSGYRHPWGLIAYTSRSSEDTSIDNRFDFSSFRYKAGNDDDWIPVGTLGVETLFNFGTTGDPGGYGAFWYGAFYYGDNSVVEGVVDVQIGDKWYIQVTSDGIVYNAIPDPANKGKYGPVETKGPFKGGKDTVYTVEIIDFWGYVQNFQDALLQICLATSTDEWVDFWGEYFGIERLLLVEGFESDADYKVRIMKEVTRAKGTKAVLLDGARAYFKSSNVDIVEYCQVLGWDGQNQGFNEDGSPDSVRKGLMPYQFYIIPPIQRAPSAKWVKAGSNLIVSGQGKVWSFEGGGYGYYGYGNFKDLQDIGTESGSGDWMFVPPSNEDDACLFGSESKFSGLRFVFITPGVGGSYVWEYWNGIGWSSLTVSDTTSGLTGDGWVNWKVPDGWKYAKNIPYNIPNVASWMLWVRVRIIVPPSVVPKADYIAITYAGQTCRGHYCGTKYIDISGEWAWSNKVGFTPYYLHQPTEDPVVGVYNPSNRDKNNCYVYFQSSWEKPQVETGLQEIIDRLKTAGTVAIINPR